MRNRFLACSAARGCEAQQATPKEVWGATGKPPRLAPERSPAATGREEVQQATPKEVQEGDRKARLRLPPEAAPLRSPFAGGEIRC